MTDPVVTLDGQVFESSLIEEWFRIRIRQDHRRAITDYMFGSEDQAADQAGQILEAFNHHNQSDCSNMCLLKTLRMMRRTDIMRQELCAS